VPLEEISPYLIAATIATEDASFYDNPGVNVMGLLRATKSNLPSPLGKGFGKGSGGSSLTQQLVKNIYMKPEERFDRRIKRKIKETVLALELKRRYDDDQILEWYLNQVDYGNFAFGAQAAAQRYFGKNVGDLTLAEAALVAGIPQAPGLLTPALPENRVPALERSEEVLALMLKHLKEVRAIADKSGRLSPEQKAALRGITPEQIEAARQQIEVTKAQIAGAEGSGAQAQGVEPLNFQTARFDIEAPHFVFYVREMVTKMCQKGVFKPPLDISCEKVVFQGGLNIITTLDLELQHMGEGVVEEVISANEDRYNGHDGAALALDPNTIISVRTSRARSTSSSPPVPTAPP